MAKITLKDLVSLTSIQWKFASISLSVHLLGNPSEIKATDYAMNTNNLPNALHFVAKIQRWWNGTDGLQK